MNVLQKSDLTTKSFDSMEGFLKQSKNHLLEYQNSAKNVPKIVKIQHKWFCGVEERKMVHVISSGPSA